MARYYWIKLKDTFFQDKHIKKLRKLPGGADCVIAYMKMMLASTKTNGIITLDGIEETPAEEIALMIDETKEVCQMTMAYGIKVGFIQQMDDLSACKLLQVEQLLDSETDDANRKRLQRNGENILLLGAGQAQDNTFRQRKLRAKRWCLNHLAKRLVITDLENNKEYDGWYYIALRNSKGVCCCGLPVEQVLLVNGRYIACCNNCDVNKLSEYYNTQNEFTSDIASNEFCVTSNKDNVTSNKNNVTSNGKSVTSNEKKIEIIEGKNQLIQSNQGFVEPVTKWDNVRTNSLDIDIEIDTYNSNYNSISTALEYYSSKIGVPSSETRSKLYNLEQQYSFEELKVAIDIAWKQKKGSIGYITKVLENERARQEEKESDGYRQTKAARKTTDATKKLLDGPDWENIKPGEL
ncbi:phage replisome organizer N-terminal domain-containing protein [Veillonella sp. VA142]|uniref:phage replisome organizer N-terminal domain-containing protein n=1 Tax=Veillonella sp. VA142 TaxID=741834 RepID=UPI000F8EB630|nr:phage replisome organizer N-terminal domain-containing protein [Veillonella sp. VA142]